MTTTATSAAVPPVLSTKWKIWTAVFGTLTVAALGMEVWGAFDGNPDTTPWTGYISNYVPELVTVALIGLLVAWLPAHFTIAYARVHKLPVPTIYSLAGWTRFRQLDAVNRAWRSFLHSVGAAALIAAVDAAGQVAYNALTSALGGHLVDWRQVGVLAAGAALTAFLTPVLAYLHRVAADPSNLPSAVPPLPPVNMVSRLAQGGVVTPSASATMRVNESIRLLPRDDH